MLYIFMFLVCLSFPSKIKNSLTKEQPVVKCPNKPLFTVLHTLIIYSNKNKMIPNHLLLLQLMKTGYIDLDIV